MSKIVINMAEGSDTSRAFNKGDLLLNDGKGNFHRTSIKELYPQLENQYLELVGKFNEFKNEVKSMANEIKKENEEFFANFTEQNSKLIPILEKIIKENQ